MPFCQECGNNLTENAKFCGECGTKQQIKTEKVEKKKTVSKKVVKTPNKIKDTETLAEETKKIEKTKVSEGLTGNISSKDTDELKRFFTSPPTVVEPDPAVSQLFGVMFIIFAGLFLLIGEGDGTCFIIALVLGGIGIALFVSASKGVKEYDEYLKIMAKWKSLSPDVLFRRLDQCQDVAAKSAFQALGINKSAKPSEGGIIRNPAYSYGPHLDFTDLIFGKVDKGGIGKGAGYYKICDDFVDGGLYTREYDMMVIQFTQNQILVYKCIFDILEMTKRLEESYEWSYKHVVGINISGDDKEKQLGESISITGTKYMVISAASGDKIEIILGAETNELVDGEKKKSHLGGEDKIFEIANAAVKNVREAIRDKAG